MVRILSPNPQQKERKQARPTLDFVSIVKVLILVLFLLAIIIATLE